MKTVEIRALQTIRLPGEKANWIKAGDTAVVSSQFARDKITAGHAQEVKPKATSAAAKDKNA